MAKKFQAGRGYTKKDWDEVSDNPALTKAQLRAGKPFAEAFPDLAKKIGRGPQKAPTKQPATIRLDADVLASYRGTGPGWQGRINADLRKARKLG